MATFMLVHGASQGASTWDVIASKLRNAGHQVHSPELIGMGALSHHLTPDVSLDMHIQDILGVLSFERLRDVTLVGHSYAGMIITGVAERASDRLARLVRLC